MKRNQTILWLALLAISVVCCLPVISMPLNVYDEGIILAGADRVLAGDVPYRDFWSMYPPGQFYALAVLFKLFGASVLVERIYDLVVRSLLATCGFLIAKALGRSDRVAIISWALALVWAAGSRFAAYPVYLALLLILVGIVSFLHYVQKGQKRWLLACGAAMALGATFRHDLAGMAGSAVLVALFVRKWTGGDRDWRSVGVYLGGVILLGGPIAIYFAAVVGIGPVIEQLILTPAEVMPKYRWLPYPSLVVFETVHFYLLPFISAAGLLLSVILTTKVKMRTPFSYGLLALTLTGTLFVNQVRVRSDTIHLFPTALVSIIIIPSLVSFMVSRPARGVKVAAVMVAVAIGVLLVGFVSDRIESLGEPYFAAPVRSLLDRAGYARTGKDLADVLVYVQDNTAEGEAIYVGVKNHDQFLINDVLVYFMADRRYGTRYHELHPGVTTTLRVQEEIARELQGTPVRMIVLREGYWPEPNQTAVDAHVDLLDRAIAANYDLVKRFGGYEVWSRKP